MTTVRILTGLARRRALAAAVVTLGLVLAFPVSAATFRLVITDLQAPLVPNSVMDLAKALGYFDREGVDVELVRVQQTPSAVAALQAGEGDMANISVDAALQLVARGQAALKAVVSPNKSLPFLIAAKQDIADPSALTGRSFGIGRVGSLDHSLSTKVIDALGGEIDSIDFVAIGQPSVRAQALAAGQIDATTMSIGVWLALPDKEGLHVLVSADDYYKAAPVVNKVNVVTDEVLSTRRDDVVKVVRALVNISRDFAAHPELWVEAMATARPDVSPDDLATLAESFSQSWSINGGLSREELEYTQSWLYATPDFDNLPTIQLSDWVDFSITNDVIASEGVATGFDEPTR